MHRDIGKREREAAAVSVTALGRPGSACAVDRLALTYPHHLLRLRHDEALFCRPLLDPLQPR